MRPTRGRWRVGGVATTGGRFDASRASAGTGRSQMGQISSVGCTIARQLGQRKITRHLCGPPRREIGRARSRTASPNPTAVVADPVARGTRTCLGIDEAPGSVGPPHGRPPSSSGLGRRPFKAVTRVRIPLGVQCREHRRSGRIGVAPERTASASLPKPSERPPGRSGGRTTVLVPWCSLECTLACQARGRGFKSRRDRHGRVAQSAERPPEKRKVTGSTPVPTTTRTTRSDPVSGLAWCSFRVPDPAGVQLPCKIGVGGTDRGATAVRTRSFAGARSVGNRRR